MKKALTVLLAALLLTGCAAKPQDNTTEINENNNEPTTTQQTETNTPVENVSTNVSATENSSLRDTVTFNGTEYDTSVSKRDLSASYDEITGTVTFSGNTINSSGNGITVTENTIKITSAGTYVLSGEGNGTVIVETDSDSKVQLILNNLTLTASDNAAILVGQADKVFFTLADNTVNTISDGSSYNVTYDE